MSKGSRGRENGVHHKFRSIFGVEDIRDTALQVSESLGGPGEQIGRSLIYSNGYLIDLLSESNNGRNTQVNTRGKEGGTSMQERCNTRDPIRVPVGDGMGAFDTKTPCARSSGTSIRAWLASLSWGQYR